jgi:prepilin-type N-terminal cleavage/methylation domain-containing protein
MGDRSTKRASGFSLLEMTIAMALGTVVLGAAVQLYSQGVAATWTVTQRAELQQDFRAASNMMTRDLSLAGVGLGQGAAIQLPTSSTLPLYGCVQTTGAPCYLGTANATGASYPTQGTTPYLYGLLPGYNAGPTINSLQTDVVTVVYTDSSFYLDCYTAATASATTVTFTAIVPTPPATTSANCTSPTGNAGAQAVNDSVMGLTAGDLVLFTFGAAHVVAEVNGSVSATSATFNSGDALKMNQSSADPKSLASTATGTTGYATRILVITYYIDNTVSPPRLMRQVSGHTPTPIVDGVTYMKFTYDLFNNATTSPAVACSNPGATSDGCAGASTGLLPNQITKINIAHMAMNSTLKGAKGGYQGLDLETSVSARDLTYSNNYPIAP